MQCAKLYLLRRAVSVSLRGEAVLLNPHDSKVPRFVTGLNLFLDSDNLIKTWLRIGKARCYDNEVLYLVLLPRNSHLIRRDF